MMAPSQSAPPWDARTRKSPGPRPAFRRLRGYAFDPSLSMQVETALVNEVVFKVAWEPIATRRAVPDPTKGEAPDAMGPPVATRLERGPVGEYVEVVDFDPASGCFYEPVDLDNPDILAQDGLAPSEGNPQFHQQMTYAVAMTTIRNFERALGRPALWAPRRWRKGQPPAMDDGFVPRLRIYPHALRDANAYYSPSKKALLFGYFPAAPREDGDLLPGGTVFTCLSHDIVAHETTHALLDGLHRRFIEPTHADALAFHEAFADIVALFQHFSFPDVLRHQIAKTRGDLSSENLLGQLAQQFGQAIGNYGALRTYIGRKPDPGQYQTEAEPHARGAILVAAIFEAFLSIYRTRVADLFRIASRGTGVMEAGALHPDLVNRLAAEASKSAQHVLNMCIRALDYCPPVDITFGDYLRAIITADSDLVPDDDMRYRIAIIEAFRRRGIYPRDVRTLSVDSLRWPLIREQVGEATSTQGAILEEDIAGIANTLRDILRKTADYSPTRAQLFANLHSARQEMHEAIQKEVTRGPFEKVTGLVLNSSSAPGDITRGRDGRPAFEVHSVQPAQRIGPDGDSLNQAVVSITQKRLVRLDLEAPNGEDATFAFRGGCTLIFDLDTLNLRYCIRKPIASAERLDAQRRYRLEGDTTSLRATYFAGVGLDEEEEYEEPFALLHRDTEETRGR